MGTVPIAISVSAAQTTSDSLQLHKFLVCAFPIELKAAETLSVDFAAENLNFRTRV